MRFEKCLSCPLIKGKQCAGPNFMTVPTKDAIEWMLAFQRLNGITNSRWAEASNVPKGTIDGLKKRADVRHDTLYPLLKALIELAGGVWGGASCPAAISGTSDLSQENLRMTQELERTKNLLEKRAREIRERTIAMMCMFGLCAGLVLLLILLCL